jgi:hypothetical protein
LQTALQEWTAAPPQGSTARTTSCIRTSETENVQAGSSSRTFQRTYCFQIQVEENNNKTRPEEKEEEGWPGLRNYEKQLKLKKK